MYVPMLGQGREGGGGSGFLHYNVKSIGRDGWRPSREEQKTAPSRRRMERVATL